MSLSLFVLTLWVFLISGPALGWFDAAPKLTAIVGMVYVLLVLIEAVLTATNHVPKFLRRKDQA